MKILNFFGRFIGRKSSVDYVDLTRTFGNLYWDINDKMYRPSDLQSIYVDKLSKIFCHCEIKRKDILKSIDKGIRNTDSVDKSDLVEISENKWRLSVVDDSIYGKFCVELGTSSLCSILSILWIKRLDEKFSELDWDIFVGYYIAWSRIKSFVLDYDFLKEDDDHSSAEFIARLVMDDWKIPRFASEYIYENLLKITDKILK